jgi:hypothetical protein
MRENACKLERWFLRQGGHQADYFRELNICSTEKEETKHLRQNLVENLAFIIRMVYHKKENYKGMKNAEL